jgi:hypothetical protein
MCDVFSSLTQPTKLWSRSEVLTRPCPVPAKPGLYAWFFKDIPLQVPVSECITWLGLTLLYVGLSPSEPALSSGKISQQNLKKRIRNHYRGNAYGSTLRLTLGCLLRETLSIRLQKVGKNNLHFAYGEKILSDWMAENAFVAWIVQDEPWFLEKCLIEKVKPPLNLKDNESHPFFSTLSHIRQSCRDEAKRLSDNND